jgi:alcohol dehydrogenase class IV
MSQHVPRRDVLLAASQARQAEADVLVSLGGGSPVDGTKAVALCLTERITSEEQLDSHRLKPGGRRLSPQFPSQSIPHIAITTTLSAGEFTHIFGITDEVRRIKDGYGAPQFVPRVVILDPELTVHTPQWLWASTGLRAVDHAVERIYSVRHQPFVDTLCLQALRYLFQNLPRSVREPQALEARFYCQLGAWMSIIGFMNVRTGISHAIGHQLGGRCNVPHGQTSCIMLPHAMDFNLPVAADRLALVAEAAGVDTRETGIERAAREAVEAVRKLVKDLGCPTRLGEVGVKESDLSLLAEAVMLEVPTIENPRPIKDVNDVIEILRRAV